MPYSISWKIGNLKKKKKDLILEFQIIGKESNTSWVVDEEAESERCNNPPRDDVVSSIIIRIRLFYLIVHSHAMMEPFNTPKYSSPWHVSIFHWHSGGVAPIELLNCATYPICRCNDSDRLEIRSPSRRRRHGLQASCYGALFIAC